MARILRTSWSFGLAALLAAGASACTTSEATSGRSSPPGASASLAPGDADVQEAGTGQESFPRLSDLPAGSVIATGEFGGRGTSGRIEIRANGDDHGFDVTLAGITPAPAAGTSLELNALPATAADAELQQGFSYYRYDALVTASDQTFTTPGAGYGGFETEDPSHLRTAVIWKPPPGAPIGLGTVVATAPLTWTLPDMNPGFDLEDHGVREGASGRVDLAEDGRPDSYRVAWGDTADGITERFGITMRDLEWLNPDRLNGRLVLADITLNLAREGRGLRG